MSRPLRIEYEGALYHVTARGNERRKTFFTRRDYEKFLEYVDEARGKFGIILHGYVLMTNHYHLIVETPERNLSRVMHHINSSYTTYINVKKKRSGHLFQGRFKSIVVDRDSYLLELSRYLHLNPVRARMVERPEEYLYSSYRTYIGVGCDPRITTSAVFGLVGVDGDKAPDCYRNFVESALGTELESPMEKVYGGAILGGEGFIEALLQEISADQRGKAETSYRKSLSTAVLPRGIVATVRQHYGVAEEEVLSGEHRKMCLYLLKQHSSAKNSEIGEMLGGMGAAAVAKGYQRFVQRQAQDPDLAREIEKIGRKMSRVKG